MEWCTNNNGGGIMIFYIIVAILTALVYSAYFVVIAGEELEFEEAVGFLFLACIWPVTLPLFAGAVLLQALFSYLRLP